MPFCYDKLWDITYEKKLNKTEFRDKVGITNSTLSRLSKNQMVSMEILARICEKLECNIDQIVEYKR